MLTAYLISQVLTYTYTYTFWVSSKHSAYCLPHFLGKQYAICLLLTSKVYVYVSSKHAYLRYVLVSLSASRTDLQRKLTPRMFINYAKISP